MGTKLYVGSLPYSTTDSELQELFAPHGNVVSASIINDRYSGQSKGFGFVEMSSEEEAQKAIEALNGQALGGREIVVNEARPQEKRSGGFGGGGGGGFGGNRRGGGGGGGGRGGNRGGGGGGAGGGGGRGRW